MKTIVLLIASFVAVDAGPPAFATEDPLAPLNFLIGSWHSDTPAGSDRFVKDLEGHVIVRTAQSAQTRPGQHIPMRSLMSIYADADGSLRAIYFDNEGHAVRYNVADLDATHVRFVSEGAPGGPRFRLTYAAQGHHALNVTFEIAGPQEPAAFRTVAQATETRSAH